MKQIQVWKWISSFYSNMPVKWIRLFHRQMRQNCSTFYNLEALKNIIVELHWKIHFQNFIYNMKVQHLIDHQIHNLTFYPPPSKESHVSKHVVYVVNKSEKISLHCCIYIHIQRLISVSLGASNFFSKQVVLLVLYQL